MEQMNLSAEALAGEAKVNLKKWNRAPTEKALNQAIEALESHNIKVILVESKKQALEKLVELIPTGSEIMNGSSTTLIEIGFVDFLQKEKQKWKNLHEQIFAEANPSKQADLRRKAITADFFVSGVNAITKKGELVACDASGSRVGAFHFGAKNLVVVSGTNKIVENLSEAMKRIEEFVFPLENARAKKVYGAGSSMNKFVVLAKEGAKGRVTLILVKESLGY
ncbi:MAG: lactate utilization protein [Candidatus ainarchaeum sp.]|nr:lactate utilization protein [Candidatus ainarchaeum sp.]